MMTIVMSDGEWPEDSLPGILIMNNVKSHEVGEAMKVFQENWKYQKQLMCRGGFYFHLSTRIPQDLSSLKFFVCEVEP